MPACARVGILLNGQFHTQSSIAPRQKSLSATRRQTAVMWTPANNLEQERLDKLNDLRNRQIEPYPNRVQRTHTTAEAIRAFEAVESDSPGDPEPVNVTVAGRIVRQNLKGKVYFAHIEDGDGRVQLFVRIDNVGEDAYEIVKQNLDLGDFVQASGLMMR